MRLFIGFLLLVFSFSQALAYEVTPDDQGLLDSVMPKFYAVIDKQGDDLAWSLVDRIGDMREDQTERVEVLLDYIVDDIKAKYELGEYLIAKSATPVLYTDDFRTQFGGEDGLTLNFDDYGEIDALEMVALEGTVFELERDLGNGIYQVSTKDYPVENDLYIHKSFAGETTRVEPSARVKDLPSKQEILERLKSMEGKDYVWGGNDPNGIPELLDIYAPAGEISPVKQEQWQLTGVDCSGLIYWASDGITPRNTSWIVDYGTPLDIVNKDLDQIIPMLEPLDIIVWRGHMMVVYDESHTIESTVSANGDLAPGVQIRDIRDSLGGVMQDRVPVNNYYASSHSSPFVIVRWYGE